MESCTLSIGGMTCAACAARVEQTLRRLGGVEAAAADLASERVSVSYDASILRRSELRAAVEHSGYKVLKIASGDTPDIGAHRVRDIRVMQMRLVVAVVFALPLLYLALAPLFTDLPLPAFLAPDAYPLAYALTQLVLSAPIIAAGHRLYVNGARDAVKLAPSLDTLAALGTAAAVGYSIYAIVMLALGSGKAVYLLYFESVAVVLPLIILGKTLESMLRVRASEAAERLLPLAPSSAMLISDGIVYEIPCDEVEPGDILLVRPGAAIPADGVVVDGALAVDESALTGGSMPAAKGPGDAVCAATTNISGVASIRADRIGTDTALARIIALAEDAPKAPSAQRSAAVMRLYVPIVCAAALLAGIAVTVFTKDVSFALTVFITILTIACPCALGLAAAVAVMAGTSRGAEFGVHFKSADALEAAHKLDMVIIGKTGVITEGHPAVSDIITINGAPEDKLLLIAASAELASEHPIGRAIVRRAAEDGLELMQQSSFSAIPGQGVEAALGSHTVLAGSRALMDSFGVDFTPLLGHADILTGQGKTPVYVAVDGAPGGIIAVSDVIKATSLEAVAALRDLGHEVVMLTGDTEQTARSIAWQVGIDRVLADVLPGDKSAAVKKLQDEGYRAAMVGDGADDAPALAQADIGVAIGCGVKAETNGDIVLTRAFLTDVSAALELGRRTIKGVGQNLFLALAFNAAGAVLAAAALCFLDWWHLTPGFAAAAMLLGCVSVLINAQRLRRFTPSRGEPNDKRNTIEGGIRIMEKAILNVEGMSCEHCVKAVRDSVGALAGVRSVEVSLKEKRVTVEHDPASASLDAIKAAITEEGYEVA